MSDQGPNHEEPPTVSFARAADGRSIAISPDQDDPTMTRLGIDGTSVAVPRDALVRALLEAHVIGSADGVDLQAAQALAACADRNQALLRANEALDDRVARLQRALDRALAAQDAA